MYSVKKYVDVWVIIWFKLPSINVAANPALQVKLAMAVAVVLCPGGNQIAANNAGPARKTVPAIPLKIAPKFINLKEMDIKHGLIYILDLHVFIIAE